MRAQLSPPGPSSTGRGARKRLLGARLLGLPMVAYIGAFFLAPLVLLVVFSFGQIDILTFQVGFGWTTENYEHLFNGLYLGAFGRSLGLTLAATAMCILLGFPAALAISRATGRVQTILLVAVVVPYWISFVVRTYAWLDLLSPNGWVANALTFFHLVPEGTELRYSFTAVGIGMVYGYLPLMILPIFVALERLDPAMIEAAADMGLSRFKTFWRVVVPLAMPGTIAGALLVGIPATGEYTIPAILGGQKSLMLGNVIADQFLTVGNFPFGAAIGSTLMVLMLLVLFASRRRLERLEDVT